jgi:anti-sigma factor RsiW
VSCANPLADAVLTDYWIAALTKSEEEAIEEHLFACDECVGRLREVIALANAVRSLAREGSLLMVVSEAFLERISAGQRALISRFAMNGGRRNSGWPIFRSIQNRRELRFSNRLLMRRRLQRRQ